MSANDHCIRYYTTKYINAIYDAIHNGSYLKYCTLTCWSIMHWAANFESLCISLTCQSIVLRSYPNPQKTRRVF